MFTFTPQSTRPYVRYFYLPANAEKQAEVIQIVNCNTEAVQVPMREEDVELTAFFQRELTPHERMQYSSSETWKVYTCWEELLQDHMQFGLEEEKLACLLQDLKYRFELQE